MDKNLSIIYKGLGTGCTTYDFFSHLSAIGTAQALLSHLWHVCRHSLILISWLSSTEAISASETSWLKKSYRPRNQKHPRHLCLLLYNVHLSDLWPWMLGMCFQIHHGNRDHRSYFFLVANQPVLCESASLLASYFVAEAIEVCGFSQLDSLACSWWQSLGEIWRYSSPWSFISAGYSPAIVVWFRVKGRILVLTDCGFM